MSINSRLKATKIIETVDIYILVASRNGQRKIMQSIRIMSGPPSSKRKWD